MPLYEFRCGVCDSRFEALVDAATETQPCRECGAGAAERVMSIPAELPRLVRSPGGDRRQEARNRALRETTKRDFKQKRKRARERAKARKEGPL